LLLNKLQNRIDIGIGEVSALNYLVPSRFSFFRLGP